MTPVFVEVGKNTKNAVFRCINGKDIPMINVRALLLIIAAMNISVFARSPKNFSIAKQELRRIFSFNRETLYCGWKYDKYNHINLKSCGMSSAKNFKRAQRVEWEHIVPASYFGQFRCWREKICSAKRGKKYKGRKCCEKTSFKFRAAESELYNLSNRP